MDLYTESVIYKKPIPGGTALLTVLAVLAGFSLLLGQVHILFWIPALIFGAAAFLLWRNTDVEYEYIHTGNILDVDKVMRGSSRKSLVSIDLNHVIVIAPLGSPVLNSHSRLGVLNYTGGVSQEDIYVMVCVAKSEKKRVLLQLEPKMLDSLKKQIPGKFV